MRRLFLPFILLASSFASAEESYLSLYLQGSKIGYVYNTITDDTLDGKAAKRSDSKTTMSIGALGQAVQIEIISTTWTDSKGGPLLVKFSLSSAGRTQTVDARFGATDVLITTTNGDSVVKKTLKVPKDGRIVDDAVAALLEKGAPTGRSAWFYVLDPMLVTFVKNTVRLVGKSNAVLRGLEFEATLVEVTDPRATVRVFISSKGDLIKAEGPLGIEMIPATKEEALREESAKGGVTDIAVLSRIKPDKPLGDISRLKFAKLLFKGSDLKKIPSDGHQTVGRSGNGWIVETHPVQEPSKGAATIDVAAKGAPQWVKPGLNIPSSRPEFKKLSKTIVGKETNVVAATEKVRQWVTRSMRPNAGIGVLRDAAELLKTKEGVCRDYAVLTSTILRATGIPSRLCSGIVYHEGAFYYHAWVEAFDGKRWFGIDSTRPDGKVTPGHVKLAQGSVEDAFLFTFLDRTTVEVLETKG